MSDDQPTPPGGLAPGSRIAGYLIEQQIGHGGMAVVFRAIDERLERQVALKILSPALAQDEAFRQRFIRESRAAAAVDDPHIIPVFEAGEAAGVLFIAMRYVGGGDVRSLLSQHGPLPAGQTAEIVSQVASALDAAHRRGLVHRDVKPANMLLDSGGGAGRPDHVYLSDFGVSKALQQATNLTGTGQFLGSLDYIAPEQIESRDVDGRADQYALACAAFELLAGEPPFRRDEAMAVMYAQLSAQPPALSSYRPDLPVAADAVFFRVLAKNPANRYATCRDFADALREALGINPFDSGQGTRPPAARPVTEVVRRDVPSGESPRSGGDTMQVPLSGAGTAQGTRVSGDWPELTSGQIAVRQRRRPAVLLGALVGLLVLGGGGGAYVLLGHGAKASGNGGSPTQSAQASLPVPGCSTGAAPGTTLTTAQAATTAVTGQPFAAVASPDGKDVFVSTPTAIEVLVRGSGASVLRQYPYTVVNDPTLRPKGMALTGDGKYLVVGADNGIVVLSVPALEQGAPSASVATLPVPGMTNGGAEEVAVSPDNKYAFVLLQNANQMAVFNLAKAVSGGSGTTSFVGAVTLFLSPVGIAVSPDGKWIYVASQAVHQTKSPEQGMISVLDLARAESSPQDSVVSATQTGCGPGRIAVSADGSTVWVTARSSDAVLGFSASRLRTDKARALLYDIPVGRTPIGAILVGGGKRLIVSDNDPGNSGATAHNLAVIDVTKAMAGQGARALLGYIPGGQQPRDLALVPGTTFLLVADSASNEVQWIDLSKLP